MKLQFIILIIISGATQINCMDFKKALLKGPTQPIKKVARVTCAMQEEQDEIIADLQHTQSDSALIIPRVNTAEVNKQINEAFFKNNGYRTKTELAVSLGTMQARQWFLDYLQKPAALQEAVTILHEYIAQEDIHNIRRLLEWTAQDKDKTSCLIRYKHNVIPFAHETLDRPEILALVLNAGANPDALDKQGNTPLHIAAYRGIIDSVRYLLQAGANPNIHNTSNTAFTETPLLCAIEKLNATNDYKYYIIAACLVHNKEGNGPKASCTEQNRIRLSARDIVQAIPHTSIERQKLKTLIGTDPRVQSRGQLR